MAKKAHSLPPLTSTVPSRFHVCVSGVGWVWLCAHSCRYRSVLLGLFTALPICCPSGLTCLKRENFDYQFYTMKGITGSVGTFKPPSSIRLILKCVVEFDRDTGKEGKTTPKHTFPFWICDKPTAGISVVLFDTKSYWSLLHLARIPQPTHTHTHTCNSQILPHSLCSRKIVFRPFRDARHTQKIILREYYFKTQTISTAEMRHYVGVEQRGDTGLKNDTTLWAISFSGSKRNIWPVSAPKSTNEAKETV